MEAKKFAVLQKLFRNAIHGRLGNRFPVKRLIDLAKVTVVEIGKMRTLRWRPKELRLNHLLVSLYIKFDEISYEREEWNDGLKEIRSCVAELIYSRSVTDVDWDEVCFLGELGARVRESCDLGDEASCSLQDGIAIVERLISTVEMRLAFGVTEEERLLREVMFESCTVDRR